MTLEKTTQPNQQPPFPAQKKTKKQPVSLRAQIKKVFSIFKSLPPPPPPPSQKKVNKGERGLDTMPTESFYKW